MLTARPSLKTLDSGGFPGDQRSCVEASTKAGGSPKPSRQAPRRQEADHPFSTLCRSVPSATTLSSLPDHLPTGPSEPFRENATVRRGPTGHVVTGQQMRGGIEWQGQTQWPLGMPVPSHCVHLPHAATQAAAWAPQFPHSTPILHFPWTLHENDPVHEHVCTPSRPGFLLCQVSGSLA